MEHDGDEIAALHPQAGPVSQCGGPATQSLTPVIDWSIRT
jgi:hypothetical protein